MPISVIAQKHAIRSVNTQKAPPSAPARAAIPKACTHSLVVADIHINQRHLHKMLQHTHPQQPAALSLTPQQPSLAVNVNLQAAQMAGLRKMFLIMYGRTK